MSSDEAMLNKFNKITPFISCLRNTIRHWFIVKMPHTVLPTYHMISSMSSDKTSSFKTFYFMARILFLLGVPWWGNRGRDRGGGAPGPASAPQEPVSTERKHRNFTRQQCACSCGFFETWSICPVPPSPSLEKEVLSAVTAKSNLPVNNCLYTFSASAEKEL